MDRFFMATISFVFLCACDEVSEQVSETATSASPSRSPIASYGRADEMPICDESNQGTVAYAEEDRAVYFCDGSAFVRMSYSKPEEFAESEKITACESALESKAEPSGLNGLISFKIASDVDPCSVSGYIVGKESELKIYATKNGDYFINNVPSGMHDLVISASASEGFNLSTASHNRGMRLNNVASMAGNSNEIGLVSLKPMGEIAGVAKLSGSANIADHAGISVYIPGTSISAKTNETGQFSMKNIPPGVHKIFFEKDGFNRGQISAITIESEVITSSPEIVLNLSTIEVGTFFIQNAFKDSSINSPIINSLDLNTVLIPPKTASLMLLKVNSDPGIWQPLRTNLDIPIDLDSLSYSSEDYVYSPSFISVRAKFADTNGLESDMVQKDYRLDLFSDGVTAFKPKFKIESQSDGGFRIYDFEHPSQAERVDINVNRMDNYYENPKSISTGFLDISDVSEQIVEIEDHALSCGLYKASLTYEGYQGKVRSNNYYDSPEYYAFQKCYEDVTSEGAPQVSTYDYADTYYKAAWTGSIVFVLGYDLNDDNRLTAGIYDPDTTLWTQVNGLDDSDLAPSAAPSGQDYFELEASQDIVAFTGIHGYSSGMYFYHLSTQQWINPLEGFTDFPLNDVNNLNISANNDYLLLSGYIDCNTYRANFLIFIDGKTGSVAHSALSEEGGCINPSHPNAFAYTPDSILGSEAQAMHRIFSLPTSEGFLLYDEAIYYGDNNPSDRFLFVSYNETANEITLTDHSQIPDKIQNGSWSFGMQSVYKSLDDIYLLYSDSNINKIYLFVLSGTEGNLAWEEISLPPTTYYSGIGKIHAHIVNEQLVINNSSSGVIFLKFNGESPIHVNTSWNTSYIQHELPFNSWAAGRILANVMIPESDGFFIWGGLHWQWNGADNTQDIIGRSDGIIYKLDYKDH